MTEHTIRLMYTQKQVEQQKIRQANKLTERQKNTEKNTTNVEYILSVFH